MVRIRHTTYAFTRKRTPLSVTDYEKIRLMNSQDFEEYLRAVRATSWRLFRAERFGSIRVLCLGASILIVTTAVFQAVDVIAAIWVLLLIGCVYESIGLAMSASSFSSYVRASLKCLRHQRELVLVSNTYAQYLHAKARLI
jgi:hypothetical protein